MTGHDRLDELTTRRIGKPVGDGRGNYLEVIVADDLTTGRWIVHAPDGSEHEYEGPHLFE